MPVVAKDEEILPRPSSCKEVEPSVAAVAKEPSPVKEKSPTPVREEVVASGCPSSCREGAQPRA